MSKQTRVNHLEPFIHIVLSEHIKQRLDHQIEQFMATWVPQIHDYTQFRYVFDGLMRLGQTSSAQTEQLSQDLLVRKLKKQHHSKNLEDIFILLKQLQQLLQVNPHTQKTLLQRFKKPQAEQTISIEHVLAAQAVMYTLIDHMDAQHASLAKDNLYLEHEHHALSTATAHNEQSLYIAEQLNQTLGLWQQQASAQVRGLSENLNACQQYLQMKQHDLLQQKVVNIQAMQSLCLIHQNNRDIIEHMQRLTDRMTHFFHHLDAVQMAYSAQQASAKKLQHIVAELHQDIDIILQRLD